MKHVACLSKWASAVLLTSVGSTGFAFSSLDAAWPQRASTHLIELAPAAENARVARSLRSGGYELSTGHWVDFDRWYKPSGITDIRITWMTQLHPQWGLIWGLSTGEHGQKYRVDPSLKLGLVFQARPSPRDHFSFQITTLIGGRLRERACTADYGAIGGVQTVNCRLAASTLAPADTLRYLINAAPIDKDRVFVRYVHEF